MKTVAHFLAKPYSRTLAMPLRTGRRQYATRDGWLLKDPDSGRFAEIAPWPEAGSESHAEVRAWLELQNNGFPDPRPELLPATAFALDCLGVETSSGPRNPLTYSPLIPADQPAAKLDESLFAGPNRSFKRKIGLKVPEEEFREIDELLQRIPEGKRLRLDANQSLSDTDWASWQRFLRNCPACEYCEEPCSLTPENLQDRLAAYADSAVPVALDESLTLPVVREALVREHFPGYLIFKPSIMGPVDPWEPWVRRYRERIVLSSVFETGIGLYYLMRLHERWQLECEPGFGTQAFFQDDFRIPDSGHRLNVPTQSRLESIWNAC